MTDETSSSGIHGDRDGVAPRWSVPLEPPKSSRSKHKLTKQTGFRVVAGVVGLATLATIGGYDSTPAVTATQPAPTAVFPRRPAATSTPDTPIPTRSAPQTVAPVPAASRPLSAYPYGFDSTPAVETAPRRISAPRSVPAAPARSHRAVAPRNITVAPDNPATAPHTAAVAPRPAQPQQVQPQQLQPPATTTPRPPGYPFSTRF